MTRRTTNLIRATATLPIVMVTLAASGAPVRLWTGAGTGVGAGFYVDGQKAAGPLHARVPKGEAQMELSGSGSNGRYSGPLRGSRSANGRSKTLAGTWEVTLGERSYRSFTCRSA